MQSRESNRCLLSDVRVNFCLFCCVHATYCLFSRFKDRFMTGWIKSINKTSSSRHQCIDNVLWQNLRTLLPHSFLRLRKRLPSQGQGIHLFQIFWQAQHGPNQQETQRQLCESWSIQRNKVMMLLIGYQSITFYITKPTLPAELWAACAEIYSRFALAHSSMCEVCLVFIFHISLSIRTCDVLIGVVLLCCKVRWW